jgi:hypothetical protein
MLEELNNLERTKTYLLMNRDESFSLAQMNVDPFESHIDDLISKGLDFDLVQNRSDDFTIASRFSDLFWKVDWLEQNNVFA